MSTFVADLEKVNHLCIRRKEADTRRTEYVSENNKFTVKDAVWDAGATCVTAELSLWPKMGEIFMNRLVKPSYKMKQDILKHNVIGPGVGSLGGVGDSNFINWMKN